MIISMLIGFTWIYSDSQWFIYHVIATLYDSALHCCLAPNHSDLSFQVEVLQQICQEFPTLSAELRKASQEARFAPWFLLYSANGRFAQRTTAIDQHWTYSKHWYCELQYIFWIWNSAAQEDWLEDTGVDGHPEHLRTVFALVCISSICVYACF